MKGETTLEEKQDCYSLERLNNVAVVKLGKNFLFESVDLSINNRLLDIFDHISQNGEIKVVVIINRPEKIGCEEYIELLPLTQSFRNLISNSGWCPKGVGRFSFVRCWGTAKLVNC